ncbi:hypothetical protein R0K17_26475, partial [Planococcus sp. SIMBA_143]
FTAFLMWPQKDQSVDLGGRRTTKKDETASSGGESDESPEPDPVEPEPFKLTLIHTNDTHTVMDNISRPASLIEDIRAARPHHLLL